MKELIQTQKKVVIIKMNECLFKIDINLNYK